MVYNINNLPAPDSLMPYIPFVCSYLDRHGNIGTPSLARQIQDVSGNNFRKVENFNSNLYE